MYCCSVAKHIATVSIDTVCVTIHLSKHYIYAKVAMAFIDAIYTVNLLSDHFAFLNDHISICDLYNVAQAFCVCCLSIYRYFFITVLFTKSSCTYSITIAVSIDTVDIHIGTWFNTRALSREQCRYFYSCLNALL